MEEKLLMICEKSSSNLNFTKKENSEYILEGIFAEFGKENNNERIYEESEYLPHLEYLQEKIKNKRLLGELDHPEKFDVSLQNVSHLIESLSYNKDKRQIVGKIRLLDTPAGKIAKNLVDNGVPISISSRAAGTVGENKKVKIKKIFTYDLVADPGFENAVMNRVNESYGIYSKNISLFEMNDSDSILLETKNSKNMKNNLNSDTIEYLNYIAEQLNNVIRYTDYLAEGLESNIKYSEYLAENMDQHISYSEHLAENLDKNIKYSEYLAENLDKNIKYSEYLAENMDKQISYSEYLAENLDKNIKYSEYLAENMDNQISYSDYLVENLNGHIEYTKYLAENLDDSISYTEHLSKTSYGDRGQKQGIGVMESKIDALLEKLETKSKKFYSEENKYPFLSVLNENQKTRFLRLDEGTKAQIAKRLDSKMIYTEEDVLTEWKKVTEKPTEKWLTNMPKEYIPVWESLDESEKSKIIKQAKLFNLETPYQIQNFWETRDLPTKGSLKYNGIINENRKYAFSEEIEEKDLGLGYNNDYIENILNGLDRLSKKY